MPADTQLLHINIVEKMKNSKSFEMQFFDLTRCLAVSMTFLHSYNAISREIIMWVASLRLGNLGFAKSHLSLITHVWSILI